MCCKMTRCRVKKTNGEWEYGLFLAKDNNQYLSKDNILDNGVCNLICNTIGICCGFIDRLNHEIYEEDIVYDISTDEFGVIRYGDYNEAEHGWYIEYWENGAFGKKVRNFICFADSNVVENLVVIGNIYDNEKLLENSERLKVKNNTGEIDDGKAYTTLINFFY